MESEELLLLQGLSDWKYRLNNTYSFVDWNGQKRIFSMNWAQNHLFDNMWYKNIILKARQWGITTGKVIEFFDCALWKPNTESLLVAHNRESAEAIFNRKVRYAYDNLPDWIKKERPVKAMNSGEMVIDHGHGNESRFRVSVSGRSGTFDYIHVSEYGKVCATDPSKAEEIISGTLNAGANCVVTIESTAEGDAGDFYDKCIRAEEQFLLGEDLTPLDYRYFFLSWFDHPNYTFTKDIARKVRLTPEIEKYFSKVGLSDLSHERKSWYMKKGEEQGDKMTQEFPSTSEEAFSKPLKGAYYSKQMRKMLEDKRISDDVVWNPDFPVHTACDIGHSDYTVNIYFQVIGRFVHVFDCYVGEGEDNDLERMCNDMKSKPYVYGSHIAPHDMNVYEWGAGATRLETALKEHGFHFELAPKEVSLADGIELVRKSLKNFVIAKSTCKSIVSGLRRYRVKYRPDGTSTGKPDHDGSDHVDPIRYFVVCKGIMDNNMLVGNVDKIDKGACL